MFYALAVNCEGSYQASERETKRIPTTSKKIMIHNFKTRSTVAITRVKQNDYSNHKYKFSIKGTGLKSISSLLRYWHCKKVQKMQLNRPVQGKKMGELFPILLGQTCWWLHTQWMNCSLFRDRLPASQVPQEQRFTTIFTIFWVSFGCFDLRFTQHHK